MARAGEGITRGLQETLMPFLLQRFQQQAGERKRRAASEENIQNLLSLYKDQGISLDTAEPYVELGMAGMPQPFSSLGVLDEEAAGRKRATTELLKEITNEDTRALFQKGLDAGAIEPQHVFQYITADKKKQEELDRFYQVSSKAQTATTINQDVIDYQAELTKVYPQDEAFKIAVKTVPALQFLAEKEMLAESGLKQIEAGARIEDLDILTVNALIQDPQYDTKTLDWMVETYSGYRPRRPQVKDLTNLGADIMQAKQQALFTPFDTPEQLLSVWMKSDAERSDADKKRLTPGRERYFAQYYDRETGAVRELAIIESGKQSYEKAQQVVDKLTTKLNLRERDKQMIDGTVVALWDTGDAPEDVDWVALQNALPSSLPVDVVKDAYIEFWEGQQGNADDTAGSNQE